ncbi:unnamed protein product [Polarella glacialis]|uniref:SET domain-containing protein n=1 Tax=Polarella glacialis TaxID=89957 RepID=A0A813LHU8_POLGL|nr:unnamed protein product [Polarella glacialis]
MPPTTTAMPPTTTTPVGATPENKLQPSDTKVAESASPAPGDTAPSPVSASPTGSTVFKPKAASAGPVGSTSFKPSAGARPPPGLATAATTTPTTAAPTTATTATTTTTRPPTTTTTPVGAKPPPGPVGARAPPGPAGARPPPAPAASPERSQPESPFAGGSEEQLVEVRDTPDRGKVVVALKPLAVGDLVFREVPALAIDQASTSPEVPDLQSWVDSFAALAAPARAQVLKLHCPDEAAQGGTLAALLGSGGERLGNLLRFPAGVSHEEIWRLLRIVECNTFGVNSESGGSLVELLPGLSRLNHSCLPNALRGPGSEAGTVEVRAVRPVATGEELSISYLDEEQLLSPRARRRARLSGRWQFRCGCERCVGPDLVRVFRCPAGGMCGSKGLLSPKAGADVDDTGISSLEGVTCGGCGREMPASFAEKAIAAELRLAETAPPARRTAEAAVGRLSAALEARDGPAFEKAVEVGMEALARLAGCAVSCPEVAPSHHLVAGLAKAAATLRAVLGDGLAAAGRKELAQDMWGRAAAEMQEAMAAEYSALPLPRDGRIADLIGLSGLYQRLGRTDDARGCLTDAVSGMRSVYWACAPDQRASSQEMQRGVEEFLAEM